MSQATVYCSFCLRASHEVAKLVAGAGSVFICDACVAAAQAWMEGRGVEPAEAEDLPTERLLAQLPAIDATARGKGGQLEWAVDQLRAREVSWAAIGEALGVSRQSAWERFS